MIIVTGDHAPQVGDVARAIRDDVVIAVQSPPQGTGDAVKQALPALEGFQGTVIILYGDTPLMQPHTLIALAHDVERGQAVSVLGFRPSRALRAGEL